MVVYLYIVTRLAHLGNFIKLAASIFSPNCPNFWVVLKIYHFSIESFGRHFTHCGSFQVQFLLMGWEWIEYRIYL